MSRRVDPGAPRVVVRTARVGLRVTSAQRRRCFGFRCLKDKAEQAGIGVELVDERGSSSTCPVCGRRVPNPPAAGSVACTVVSAGTATWSAAPTSPITRWADPSPPARRRARSRW
ncbi:zinc ribbon domain-containing protein [Actinoallomurus soli]|uniref:zinc ribbon domain-containing protein n=1 Tax=Actinoallomurus soli TaxID=2952535 RepID=UPI003872C1CA